MNRSSGSLYETRSEKVNASTDLGFDPFGGLKEPSGSVTNRFERFTN
jgi:hypothetical protein